MKKHLLSTSAIALGVVAAAPASAQDWDLNWGGFFSSHIAIVDVSGGTGDFDGINFLNTGEIIFSPSVTLDNGLTFGANVQFEAQNNTAAGSTNNVDESYISISGDSFGRLVVGAENSAGYLLSTAAPTVTSMYINSPSISAFIPLSGVVPFGFRQAGVSAYTEVAGNNDVSRLTYFTPNFNGFQAGISYARNSNGNADQGFGATGGGQTNNSDLAALEDIWDIGLAYNQTFGSVDVSLSARYGQGSVADGATAAPVAGSGEVNTWAVGAQFGFGAFTVGGAYAENNNNDLGVTSSTGWNLGVTYDAAGPWSFGFETYQGEYVGSGTGGADEDYRAYSLAASRDLGPGVDWDIYYIYAEAEDGGDSTADIDGNIIGTAINLSF